VARSFIALLSVSFAVGCVSVTTTPAVRSKPKATPGGSQESASTASEGAADTSAGTKEWPSVERVVNDMRTEFHRESAAKAARALRMLSFFAFKSGDKARSQEYQAAAQSILDAEKARYDPGCMGNTCDAHFLQLCESTIYHSPVFMREIMDRYFAPPGSRATKGN